jgi:protein TonB
VPGGTGQSTPKTAARFDLATLNNPAPHYPYSARDNHEEGLVVVKVHVSADGAALEVTLHKSSGVPALDAAAVEVVRIWRFIPARISDLKVDDWVLVPFNFRLRSAHKPS